MYVRPGMLAKAASEVAGRDLGPPFFREPILLDGDLTTDFLRLHLTLEGDAPALEKDSRLLDVLTRLVQRRAEGRPSAEKTGRERRAVGLAREYLEDNRTKKVSLEELASLVHLSPYHLTRVFKEEVGLPPHAYQTQARLRRAKDLLLRGWPVSRVAHETGFFDQSHFARHFKRLVGVPPGEYAAGDPPVENSKNVHYGGP
jgi:AraC-like DNA-binding protein